MTEVELENKLAYLEQKIQTNEAAINASHRDSRAGYRNLSLRVGHLEEVVDAAITTAVHELIDYLRHDDIQNLDEAEFGGRSKEIDLQSGRRSYSAVLRW